MTTTKGIDVSDWNPFLAALRALLGRRAFVIAKASQGTGYRASHFRANIRFARALGKVTGAYHFGDAADGAAQARHFLDTIRAAGFNPASLLLFLDLEHNTGPGGDMTEAGARAFLAEVKAEGYEATSGLYYGASRGRTDLGQRLHWIASYGARPTFLRQADFWQSGGSGIDQDEFEGSPADLRAIIQRMRRVWWVTLEVAGEQPAAKGPYRTRAGAEVIATWWRLSRNSGHGRRTTVTYEWVKA